MLILNYYISFQVLLFTALWNIMRIIVRADKNPVKQVIRVLIPTLIAPCIGALLLIPTALELANSPKDITQLGLTLTGSNLLIRDGAYPLVVIDDLARCIGKDAASVTSAVMMLGSDEKKIFSS